MKQIPLLQGNALLIELPEGAHPQIYKEDDPNVLHWQEYGETEMLALPPGNWRIIGMLSEVTEDGLDGLIKPVKVFDYDAHYWNYKDKEYQPIRVDESLESAILAEGWYFQHPQGDTPLYYTDRFTGEQKIRADWEYGQSRVLCRERCLLLGREDG